ncbi:hybrid sensor histidine kinase/response regulator transcription factor [Algoriphagus zhangzhouensis]|uniref:histidine kinase n=1 Tax=Algoriphagus zhangzhouensis TaxID=1073327 RepID=A0A1M7Z3M0_9BACT|nr:hybrid sensor histidine kinase/response regulator transcription factor [Algoriphagus zhangzhouensis]TDY48444.1 signal transduction histidine kinase [Algoriphagus zhangzhouensis]SHO59491.1 Signal transduction histidine kinase [Algoriphagus zhangzhouensis]
MGYLKIFILYILVVLNTGFTFYDRDSITFAHAPTSINIQNFGLSDGLAVYCLGTSFLDQKGRLWANPCQEDARELRMSFFQFDGEQSFFYEIKPDWIKEGDLAPVWYLLGITSEGDLFGADLQNETLFSWNPDTREQFFFKLNEGSKLLNAIHDPNGGILALTLEGENQRQLDSAKYHLINFDKSQNEEIGSIQLNFDGELSPTPPRTFAYSLDISNGHAWFFHQQKGLVKAALNSGEFEFIPWTQFEGIPPVKKEGMADNGSGFEWKLMSQNNGKFLIFLGKKNGFFELDTQTQTLLPNGGLNQVILRDEGDNTVLRVFISKDKKGNILLVSGYPDPYLYATATANRKALLIGSDGFWVDYSDLIKELSFSYEYDFQHEGNFFSEDFKTEIGSSQRRAGVAFMDIQAPLNITKIHGSPSYKRGQIISIGDTSLVYNSDVQVNRYDLINGGWQGSRLTGGEFVRAREFSSLIQRNGKIWMSADFYTEKRVGLQSYDIRTNQIDYFPTDAKFEKFIFLNDQEVALFKDDGIDGGENGELFIFNINTQSKRPFLVEEKPFSIRAKVNDLLLLEDSLLWVGAQNGLWAIDLKKKEIEHFYQIPLLQDQDILLIHEDDKGKLWLGTGTQGLLIFDPKSLAIQQISESQGLANNTVVGILSDDEGNQWVSTYNGITVVDSEGMVLLELNQKDGLIHEIFHKQACYRMPNGKMVFAGYAGTIILDPKEVLEKTALKKSNSIYLTSLEYFDSNERENRIRQGSYELKEPLIIPAAQRFLKLDFALSDYGNMKEHAFLYRLLPLGTSLEQESAISWINIGSASEVTINNIPPGEYRVQVKGSDFKSNQTLTPLEIPIYVKEYFYKQWWFYILISIPVLLAIYIYVRRIQTERNRLEVEVHRRTKKIQEDKETITQQAFKLQELDESKSRFFTNISHEFRTPLTVILGVSDQIQENEKEKSLIRRNAKLLLNLVNQILRLRKLESGPESAHFIQGDVLGHIQYIIESFESLSEEKGVAVSFESKSSELLVDYDPEKILHIVSNLLTNAIKFTPRGGHVSVTLNDNQQEENPFYEIVVSDNGIGIPEDKLGHIFDRFYQVDDEYSRTGSGTGIGLTLVWELVKILNGEISVSSKEGESTTFTVRLPISHLAGLEEPEHAKIDVPIHLENANSQTLTYKEAEGNLPTLLIVEDNADVRSYIASCLDEEYQIQVAVDGQMGIEMALEQVPDIILSDVMMPKADGLALCQNLKNDEKTSHIPIVLLTAKADIESRISGLERGADAYLAKPFDKRELLIQLQNLLAQRQRLWARYGDLKELKPSEDIEIKQEDEFIIRLREIVQASMEEESFGVPELCKKAYMSRTQLHNKIKSLTNKSTSHFIKQVRLEKAVELLCTTDLNISQVALEIGLDSLSYFSRIFTEEFGVSPNKYREIYCHKQ